MRTGSFGMVLRGPEVSVVEGGGKGIETEGPMGEVRLGDWRRALWAVFFREFMPHVVMAACVPVICVVVAALIVAMKKLEFQAGFFYEHNVLSEPLTKSLTLIGCPLIGMFIGVMQARRDSAADIWSFMMHRPVGRGVLFVGRMLAGLALYGIAAGLPVAALLLFAASPQGGRPFHWLWTLPTVADVLSGLVYYFAGLLVVQREGFLLGSRLLPVLVAAACSAVMAMVPVFWEAVGAIGLCGGVLALAAMGSAFSNGFRLGSPRLGRWATVGILFVGLAIIFSGIGLGAQWINGEFWGGRINKLGSKPESDALIRTTSYVLLRDGTLGTRTFVPPTPEEENDPNFDRRKSTTFERVWPSHEKVDGNGVDESWEIMHEFWQHAKPRPAGYREIESQQTEVPYTNVADAVRAGTSTKEEWFYVSPPGLLLGYEYSTHKFIGSIGEDGFSPPGHQAKPFDTARATVVVDLYSTVLTSRRGEFAVDFFRRQVNPGLQTPEPGMNILTDGSNLRGGMKLIEAKDRIEVYAGGSKTVTAILPLAFSPETHDIRVTWFSEQRRWAIWYDPKVKNVGGNYWDTYKRNNVVEFFDEMGKRLQRVDMPATIQFEWKEGHPPVPTAEQEALFRQALRVSGGLQTLGGLPWNLMGDWWIRGSGEVPIPWAASYFIESYWWAAGVTTALIAAGMWFLARRYQVRRRWVWVVGAVIFGPMMMFLLVSIKVLPRRVKCGACGKGTFTNRAACGSCGAGFDAPARNGTEIFMDANRGVA